MVKTSRRLKKWLDEQKCSQAWLAEQLGVTPSMVSQLLSGDRSPSLKIAARIEDLTGIPTRDFAEVA